MSRLELENGKCSLAIRVDQSREDALPRNGIRLMEKERLTTLSNPSLSPLTERPVGRLWP